ncbi:MAG: hypothetical protein NWR72_11230 [Bacteroidia bacterium]|nr:hypothetical protein [Bacteroidia bacterium]
MYDCTRHDQEGNLKFTVPCNGDGVYMGEYLEYHKTGKLWKRMFYVNGVAEDTTRLFFYKTGDVLRETPMNEGKRHGEMRTFREDGSVEELVTFVDDKKSGPSITYYKNGIPKEIFTFEANRMTGPYFFFTEDSVKLVEGEYYDGSKYGKWQHFDYEGNPLAIFTYYNNFKQGGFSVFNPEGMPYLSGNFARDLLDGDLNYYDKEGSIVKTEAWTGGNTQVPSGGKSLKDGKAIIPIDVRQRVYIMQDTVWIQ